MFALWVFLSLQTQPLVGSVVLFSYYSAMYIIREDSSDCQGLSYGIKAHDL